MDELFGQQTLVPNATNKAGKSPLHLAAAMGQLEVVKRLRNEPSTNLMAKDNNGRLALHDAIENGNVIGALLGNHIKAMLEKEDMRGRTALQYVHADGKSALQLVSEAGQPGKFLVLLRHEEFDNGLDLIIRDFAQRPRHFLDSLYEFGAILTYAMVENLPMASKTLLERANEMKLDMRSKDGVLSFT
ncbi:hypothetical protein B0H63DRAFT_304512 [Podospora didyma]|uniref:Uncharacterized protein n=1 Tax=Podospora didyma TaxID=330526 RepID=A0AAE0K5D1_9PEZI|nr:hypothetical protein B0H63DRAFT_304512 [Podospora didyma]